MGKGKKQDEPKGSSHYEQKPDELDSHETEEPGADASEEADDAGMDEESGEGGSDSGSKTLTETEKKKGPPINLLPATGDGPSPTQVAVGMQLMMQRSSFDQLSESIQKEMIKTADTLDKRGFDFSCKKLDEKSALRRWTVVPICAFALLMIGGGFFFANKLINAGDFEKAWTMLLGGFAVISALLGGAGLTGILKSLGKD